jgi:hypothetical protein
MQYNLLNRPRTTQNMPQSSQSEVELDIPHTDLQEKTRV